MRLSKEAPQVRLELLFIKLENRQLILTQILADAAQLAGLYPPVRQRSCSESEGLKNAWPT